jgi:hypothetical protein
MKGALAVSRLISVALGAIACALLAGCGGQVADALLGPSQFPLLTVSLDAGCKSVVTYAEVTVDDIYWGKVTPGNSLKQTMDPGVHSISAQGTSGFVWTKRNVQLSSNQTYTLDCQ